MNRVELLSPAGDFETALAAFDAGADAVYCGLSDYSARAFAKNFSEEDLKNLVRVARSRGKKVYVTFNTLLDEDDLEGAVERLATLAEIGPDALIVQDLGVARLCRRHFPSLVLHASTQLVAHNLEGVLALGELGFTRVVLAREVSLADIASISKRCRGIELECFIHGALCYSISGLCLFSALEKNRSGNRGQCAYCCRQACGGKLPFSMKDLRLGEDVRRLADAGVASVKIEGRMKSALYVASVTRWYRQFLDAEGDSGEARSSGATRGSGAIPRVTQADLETVFSRRTTKLYLDGTPKACVIDDASLGHLGTPVGTLKRVTKDREGRSWLRFHTARALEKHDGLQFAALDGGKPAGFGIVEMRPAISRTPVCEVGAGTDVEVLLPAGEEHAALAVAAKPGATVYCAMSNAVKRMFPAPSFRPSDYPGLVAVDVALTLSATAVSATAKTADGVAVEVSVAGTFDAAKVPEKTFGAVEKALSKLGGTDYRLGRLTVDDAERRFAPMSALNDLRRELVEKLDEARRKARQKTIEEALGDEETGAANARERVPSRSVKIRAGQPLPPGEWDEIVVAIYAATEDSALRQFDNSTLRQFDNSKIRLSLPVYTPESEFNRLRVAVKRFARMGYAKWEAADLAGVRLLKQLGVTDVTADWSLYACNSQALAEISALGVSRFVASPENAAENRAYLAESGYPVAFLKQQSTPLFISLTEPAGGPRLADANGRDLVIFRRDGLWVTTRPVPRVYPVPEGAPVRVDLSWDLQQA